jgi:septum formation protein
MKRIILASTSPRRREILNNVGLTFEVIPGTYEEDMTMQLTPAELVKTLSHGKAMDVAKNYTDAIVIGADTIVAHDGKVIGKPKSEEGAKEMLRMLSGTVHSVFTGMTVIDTTIGKEYCIAVETVITFKKLTEPEIETYVKTGEPMDKAGAYAMQGIASLFIERIEGDYWGLVGLPICELGKILKELGVDIL